jgi:outer membrane protein OmpA-like peptidoglycan-associated protein
MTTSTFWRKTLALALWSSLLGPAFGQNSAQKNALQYKFSVTDYNSLDARYRRGTTRFLHPDDVNYAAELGYVRYLNSSVNLGTALRIGGIDAYINDSTRLRNHLFAGLDVLGYYKFNNGYILPENSLFSPYLLLGVGGKWMQYRQTVDNVSNTVQRGDLQLPMGLGANIRLAQQFHLQIQAEFRPSLLIGQHNLNLSMGFVWTLGKPQTSVTPQEPKLSDRDKDGIKDEDDACPEVAGLAEFQGCPDTDGDGISDAQDLCPQQTGPKATNGCPDTDGDGLSDQEDECPKEAGPKENKGCPLKAEIKTEDLSILKEAMDNVQFETGSAKLLPSSVGVLDKVADLLQRYPTYQLKIYGHTDNAGGTSANLTLSQNRAKTCYEYLIQQGVAAPRLSYKGFGETKPIVPNNTVENRAKNRRVEFILEKP